MEHLTGNFLLIAIFQAGHRSRFDNLKDLVLHEVVFDQNLRVSAIKSIYIYPNTTTVFCFIFYFSIALIIEINSQILIDCQSNPDRLKKMLELLTTTRIERIGYSKTALFQCLTFMRLRISCFQ